MKTFAIDREQRIPALGLGTWKLVGEDAYQAVTTAISVGYRHFDCARIYANESDVGRALSDSCRSGMVQRDDLWVTSKLWNDCHRPEHVKPALQRTLTDLQLDYLDLYLMHWPVALRHGQELPESGDDFVSLEEVPLESTWSAMEDCLREGLCRNLGVSNFSRQKIQQLIDGGTVKPAMDQVESHPLLQQNELLEYCLQQNMLMTAYSPLGSADRPERLRKTGDPVLLENIRITEIAEKYRISPAQVLIAWAINRGTIVIPKSASQQHLEQNFAAANIVLDSEDMQAIAALDEHYRIIDGKFWEMPGSGYTAAELWNE